MVETLRWRDLDSTCDLDVIKVRTTHDRSGLGCKSLEITFYIDGIRESRVAITREDILWLLEQE